MRHCYKPKKENKISTLAKVLIVFFFSFPLFLNAGSNNVDLLDNSEKNGGGEPAFYLHKLKKKLGGACVSIFSKNNKPEKKLNPTGSFSAWQVFSCDGGLISNPGFESDFTDWDFYTNTVISNDSYYGTKAAVTSGASGGIGKNVPALVGDVFSLEVYAKKNAAEDAKIGIKFLDGGYNEISATYKAINSPSYQSYQISAVAPDGTAYVQAIGWKNDGPGTASFDGFCFQKWDLATPTCANNSCELLPSWGKYVWSMDDSGTNDNWKDYDTGGLILCDNGDGTLSISGNLVNGHDAAWHSSNAVMCGVQDGWRLDLVLSDRQSWAEFMGNVVQNTGCEANKVDWDYWQIAGTMTGTGCNAGRTITISSSSTGYRAQVGWGGNSQSCNFGISTWMNATENGQTVQADLYAHLDADCYNNLKPETCDNGIDDDGDGLADCYDSDCAPQILFNESFESIGNTVFDDNFEGNPAVALPNNSTLLPNWKMEYGCGGNCFDSYWIDDTDDLVNNPNGDYFFWIPGASYCARQNISVDMDKCYEITMIVAAWSVPGPQSNTTLELEAYGGGIDDDGGLLSLFQKELPASPSWQNLNWQNIKFTWSPPASATTKFYISQNNSSTFAKGIVVDQILIKEICCAGNSVTPDISCEEGRDVELNFVGINNAVPNSLAISDLPTVESIIVEVIYKGGNPGSSITVEDADGNSYTANRQDVGSNAYVYRTTLPPTSAISYSETYKKDKAQSLSAFVYRNNQPGKTVVTEFTAIGGYSNTYTLDFAIPKDVADRNVKLVLPISEITYDNRRLDFVVTAGDVSTSLSRTWGPGNAGFPNGCCMDTIEFFLENVAPDVDLVSVDVISPGGGAGQSFVIAATIAVEIFCEEICGNGIDDDGDGFVDNEDQDCLCPEIYANGETSLDICGGDEITFSVASNAPNPPYSTFEFYRFDAPQANPYISTDPKTWLGNFTNQNNGSGSLGTADFPESANSNTTYYIYAILNPAPQDPSACAPFVEYTVTVKPGTAISVSADATICADTSTTISASAVGAEPFVFQWGQGLGEGESQNVAPTENTVYSVTVTSGNGCSDDGEVSINVLPSPTVDAGLDVSICQGFSTTLEATGNGGTTPYTFKWSNNLGSGDTKVVSPPATTIYGVTLTSDNGCLDTDSVTVTVGSCIENCYNGLDDDGDGLIDCDDDDCAPTPTAGQDVIICGGASANLAASAPGDNGSFDYEWSHGLGAGAFKTVSPLSTTTFTVTVTNAAGCSATAEVTVTVNYCPEVCADGIDNDGDGLIDCDDPDCSAVGAPSLTDDEFTTCPGLPMTERVNLNDANLQDAVYNIVTFPSNGVASMDVTGKFTYTPLIGGCGADLFIYEVCNQATGCCATAAAVITIGDETAPLLTNVPADITIGCDEMVPDPSTVLAFDECPGIYIEFNETTDEYNAGSCSSFAITRTWVATDLCGNSASASQVITVEDLEAPELFRVYTLPSGRRLLAGVSQRTNLNRKYIPFPITFDKTPLVFSQVISSNEGDAVVVSHQNISTQGFELRLNEQEANSDGHSIEQVAWLAIEPDTLAGVFETGLMAAVNNAWQTLNLDQSFTAAPQFIFSAQTVNEPDPFSVRYRNTSANSVQLKLQEEKSQDSEMSHANESLAYFAIEKDKIISDEDGGFVGESGSLSLTHAWATVNLDKSYNKPVVIMGGISNNGGQPVTLRVRNVTQNSFEVRLQEWEYLDGAHAVENVSYLVVEGGLPMDADTYCAIDFKLEAGVNVFVRDNCDNLVTLDYSESSSLQPDGLEIVRQWTATDDCGNALTFQRDDNCTVASIRLSALLYGAAMESNGSDLMRDDLRQQGLVPLSEPYSDLSYFYHKGNGGGETASPTIFDVEGDDAVVDWVFVEIRDSANSEEILTTASVLLKRDGRAMNFAGEDVIYFPELREGSYAVTIRHRNHLGIMTGQPWFLSSVNIPYLDFSDLNVGVFEKQASYLQYNGRRALWAGDMNGDRQIIYQGPYNDIFYLFSKVLSDPGNADFLANYISYGYDRSDMDMDGRIIYQGPDNERAKLLYYATLNHPYNTSFLANYIVLERLP